MIRLEDFHLQGRLDGPAEEDIVLGVLAQGGFVDFTDIALHRFAAHEVFQVEDHEIEEILPRFTAQADFDGLAHDRCQVDFLDSLAADAGKGLDDGLHVDGVQEGIEDLTEDAFCRLEPLFRMEIIQRRAQDGMMFEDVVHIGNGQDFIFNHMPGHFGNAFLAVRNEGRLKGDAQRPAE